ncbi:virulence protein SciE type [Novosphingobium sp. PC22D]|uniref:type VI secretion system accessory protein TagJ n=1 Tax=Novosphingobium sp. PC22D TaxID=1962403 RepID=UPI000BF039D4|nr:type VI secretion system accessory protein TagJ [Novosphingobium sp. PC22D]PEQ14584.1 virulence protein SciE type [Novosphingobium sp. PC22D]
MDQADALLDQGDIDGARAALVDVVRQNPADTRARMFLFQLLALCGERAKARKQLEMLAQLSPEAQMLAVAYGQAIEAEEQRAKVFAGECPASLLVPSAWAGDLVDALNHFIAGRTAEGEACRDKAFDQAPDTAGSLDGQAFEWIADADSRFGPAFEVIMRGQYGLVAFDSVASITSEGPGDLRDVLWYPVEIALRSGQSVAGFIPARYPGTDSAQDDSLRLCRSTDWVDRDWGQEGLGQRLWTLSGGEDVGLLSVRELVFT